MITRALESITDQAVLVSVPPYHVAGLANLLSRDEVAGHELVSALANLLENAWKFTARQPAARIEFGTVTTAGEPAYFVRDNGAGFDMTYVDRL